MTLVFPINPKLAAKAYRIQKTGLKGKDTAEKLGKGLTTTDANLLASVGRADAADSDACFTENERKVLVALLKIERSRRRQGEASSPKAWMLCRPTGLTDNQVRRATKRIGRDYGEQSQYGLLHHSVNGHIWLTACGVAVADALIAASAGGAA